MPGIITMPDMYTPAELTEAINKLPLMPQRLRPLFTQRSVRTTKVALDIKHGRLVLVSNQDRREPPPADGRARNEQGHQILQTAHLPLADL